MRKLLPEEIWGCALGCHDLVFDGRAVQFRRMPEAMVSCYRPIEARFVRTQNTTGVGLVFSTDSASLRIALRYSHASRPFYDGSVIVEGKRIATFGSGPLPAAAADRWEGVVQLPVHGESIPVELWLPHQVRADLERLEIDDGCFARPVAPPQRKWLALGDSITQGMVTALPDDAWVAVAARALNLDCRNYGIGGAQLNDFLAETDLGGWPFDVATVSYGSNDFNHSIPASDVQSRGRRLFERLRRDRPSATIFGLCPAHWLGRAQRNDAGWALEDYRQAVKAAAAEVPGVVFVNGQDLIRPEPELYVDGVHPNEAGMAEYGRGMIRTIRGLTTEG